MFLIFVSIVLPTKLLNKSHFSNETTTTSSFSNLPEIYQQTKNRKKRKSLLAWLYAAPCFILLSLFQVDHYLFQRSDRLGCIASYRLPIVFILLVSCDSILLYIISFNYMYRVYLFIGLFAANILIIRCLVACLQTEMRKTKKLPGNFLTDLLSACFCCICTVKDLAENAEVNYFDL